VVVAFAGIVLAVAVPEALGSPLKLRNEPGPGQLLRYREILDYVVVVPVSLNGRGPFDLVLDTAATFTTLEPGLAAELGLEPLGRATLATIAGARAATRTRVDRLRLGALEVPGVEVLCGEIAALRSADRRVRGVLGQTALARMSFGLDHGRKVIVFEPPARPDAVLPLDESDGRPAVRFHPRRSGEALFLVLDSALSAPVLFAKDGATLPVERVAGGFFEAETNSGHARLAMARLEGGLGGVRLDPILAAVQRDGLAGGRAEDGLLPTRLFRIVYFDRALSQVLLQSR
jgi:hypothetical protein